MEERKQKGKTKWNLGSVETYMYGGGRYVKEKILAALF